MSAPLFRQLEAATVPLVEIQVDGCALRLPQGVPLAAALLAAGYAAFHHSARAGEPRGPHCLMGSCFQCVARIDGAANQRTCRAVVRGGMVVEFHAPQVPETAS